MTDENNSTEIITKAFHLLELGTSAKKFEPDAQTVSSLVENLRSGEASLNTLRQEAQKSIREISKTYLAKYKGDDVDAVRELINELKEKTSIALPKNSMRKAKNKTGVVGWFTKNSGELVLDVKAYLNKFENYEQGFEKIEKALHEKVNNLDDDLITQKETVLAMFEAGHNLLNLKSALEEIHDSGNVGKTSLLPAHKNEDGSQAQEIAIVAVRDTSLTQMQITNMDGALKELELSLQRTMMKMKTTVTARESLYAFTDLAMVKFRRDAMGAIQTQRLKDTAAVQTDMTNLLNSFGEDDSQDQVNASIEAAKVASTPLFDPDVIERQAQNLIKEAAGVLAVYKKAELNNKNNSAQYEQSLERVSGILSGELQMDDKGNIVPNDGATAKIEQERNAPPNNERTGH